MVGIEFGGGESLRVAASVESESLGSWSAEFKRAVFLGRSEGLFLPHGSCLKVQSIYKSIPFLDTHVLSGCLPLPPVHSLKCCHLMPKLVGSSTLKHHKLACGQVQST